MKSIAIFQRFRVTHVYRADRRDPNTGLLLIGAVASPIGSWNEKPAEAAWLLRSGEHQLYLLHDGVEIDLVPQALKRGALWLGVQSHPDRHGRDLLLSLPEFPQDCAYTTLPRQLPMNAQASAHGLGIQRPI